MCRFTIDCYADLGCPWCYIGWKNMDRAIQTYSVQHPGSEFELCWKPFYLHAAAKVSAYDKKHYYASNYGPERAAQAEARIEQAGSAAGITFNWGGKTGNTRAAHQLVLLAQSRSAEVRDAVIARLYRGSFEEGRDISEQAFLVGCALAAGAAADEGEVSEWLDSPEAGKAADAGMEQARQIEVTAVPTWVVQDRYRVGGCQAPGVFTTLFDKIRTSEGRNV